MLAWVGKEELPEVGAAGGQDQLVGLELVPLCSQGHIGELTILTDKIGLKFEFG